MPCDPHFPFDRSVPLPILYLLTKEKQQQQTKRNKTKEAKYERWK